MRIVNKIEAKTPQMPRRKRVAAYARVSMESERLQHSLSAQVSFYSSLIQSNPAWEYVGVYADNGITGTKAEAREEFNRMIADCEAGKIDIILTKSISRFARNTVDLLNTVRRLKELGVSVQFEKERIDSLTEDGELMLTLLASFAQEEIRSLSDNVKWGTRKRFEKGIPNGRFQIYGYRWEGDHLVVHEEEAKIVRLIYDNYMNGLSAETTEKQLAEMGVKSYKGQHFGNTSIRQILGNITYTGNLLFQKEYVQDPISKKSKINRGELPQYFVKNTHEAIIPMEVYQAVQTEKARPGSLGLWQTGASIPPALPAKSSAVGAERAISAPTARDEKILTLTTPSGSAGLEEKPGMPSAKTRTSQNRYSRKPALWSWDWIRLMRSSFQSRSTALRSLLRMR